MPPEIPRDDDSFRPHDRYLRALAYRMLGSRAEAEDVVQDTWLRWQGADRSEVENPRAFLSRVATHLCLDRLQSARQRREQYVGTWLPEPLVDESQAWHPGPDVATEYAQDVSMAFMLMLERLSPLERAAFLLHDVFDLDFDEVGARLQRSSAACRQLASRARQHLKSGQARSEVAAGEGRRLLQAFAAALAQGDVEALARTLAEDARFVSDGGGVVAAVPRPLIGAVRIAKALVGFARLADPGRHRVVPAEINGMPGWLMYDALDGSPVQTLAIEPGPEGRIAAVYVVRNPDKLRHLKRSPELGV
ncbi:RNA polymerase sigma factor SigJ [Aquabacterium sp. A7-Y]|uniref:RNA polymerase sigma factor SigJ n=1 Tax=Aquabacterium sp. A7-Y TaxID=1349605 RepID=UPI00223D7FB8|nr:RNA polymerase sigma factor SigJ [Aquabacterium sp. A7-Y]MCW7540583.1 RNA polymerase sigma factor SigJ [Aquabacterium sp. A7-Y]